MKNKFPIAILLSILLLVLLVVTLSVLGFFKGITSMFSDGWMDVDYQPTKSENQTKRNSDYTYIHTIQGISHVSPFNGKNVENVHGVITVAGPTFYIMQTVSGFEDDDTRTSEALKVIADKNHGRSIGEIILIDGTMNEFRPKINSYGTWKTDKHALTTTNLINSTNIRVLSKIEKSALPKPVIIGHGGRIPPDATISKHVGSVETAEYTLNLQYGLDFYEARESMLVQINKARVVSPLAYGAVFITPDNGIHATGITKQGSIKISENDRNPEIIKIKSGYRQKRLPKFCETGDSLGTIIGTIDYDWGNFTIYTTEDFVYTNNTLKREKTKLTGSADKLTVATFNVHNLDACDSYEQFNSLAHIIVENLQSPDILVLEEMQDNNGKRSGADKGAKKGSTGVEANKTFGKLITAIKQAKGPKYAYSQIDPVYAREGGEPVGNIRVGFLYNPERVSIDERGKINDKTSTSTALSDGADGIELTLNPGRIDPKNPTWRSSRPATIGEFVFNGHKVFVVGVHLNSKSSDGTAWGWNQNQTPATEKKRAVMAGIVTDFVSKILEKDKNALVLIAGDFNDYEYSNPLRIFEKPGIKNLTFKLHETERYSMNYAGNAQLLDHILISENFYDRAEYDILHVNSDFNDKASDHDPAVARIYLPR
ncbi:MAG: hypothetical protein K8S87_05000 [Planctomycetes bacterium]|nr:hypothetical protein [Planctomycetota bacterium]